MLAHKLNGIAGNLAVHVVHSSAAELEGHLRSNDAMEVTRKACAKLDSALRDAVEAIRFTLHAAGGVISKETLGVVPDDAAAALTKLSVLIEQHDNEALDAFEPLRATCVAVAGADETNLLSGLLSDYDFAAALLSVKRIVGALAAKGGR